MAAGTVEMRGCGYVLVVDDNAEIQDLVVGLLERLEIDARAVADGETALASIRGERPALVLLDVCLPGISGYEVCREIRETFGDEPRIIFVSGKRVEPYDRAAGLLIGGDDYVTKPFDPDELLARVRTQLRQVTNGNGSRPRVGGSLTAREREVLELLAQGYTQAEIAALFVLSPKTVGTHIQHVLTKLGVHNRAQAVALAHREGLVSLDSDFEPASTQPERL